MAQNTEQQDTRERFERIEALAATIRTAEEENDFWVGDLAHALLDGPVARMIADAEQAAERRGAERVTAAVDAVIQDDLEAGLDSHPDDGGCGSCLAESVHRVLHPEDVAL